MSLPPQRPIPRGFAILLHLLFFATLAAAAADDAPPPLRIYNDTSPAGYVYHGCYTETTDLPGTTGTRALYDGKTESREGVMTVPLCQAFCSANGTTYKFAGLEYARYFSLHPPLSLPPSHPLAPVFCFVLLHYLALHLGWG